MNTEILVRNRGSNVLFLVRVSRSPTIRRKYPIIGFDLAKTYPQQ